MPPRSRRAPRRVDALTAAGIVEAATCILDAGGRNALTLRALSASLSTGHGAIYHHMADMDEVLAAAADDVVGRALAGITGTEPQQALHGVALALFDALEAHPWAGPVISRAPWRPATADIYETVGEGLHAFGVPEHALSHAAGVLVNYILGVAGQNAANAQGLADQQADRTAFLTTVAGHWERLDPTRYPRLHQAAAHLAEHDDREQFADGVDLILAGIAAVHQNQHSDR